MELLVCCNDWTMELNFDDIEFEGPLHWIWADLHITILGNFYFYVNIILVLWKISELAVWEIL